MNIFEALSQGKGSINEENTSSFLAYLLDPAKDHNLNNIFLSKFLHLIQIEESEIKELLSSNIEILLERSAIYDTKSHIDITIIFSKNKEEKYKICIENKIKYKNKKKDATSNIYENQLKNEYYSICENNLNNAKIFMIYLTPKEEDKYKVEGYIDKTKEEQKEIDKFYEKFKNFDDEYNEFLKIVNNSKDEHKHISWKEIIEIIKSIANYEVNYTQYIIDSFCEYVNQIIYTGKSKFFDLYITNCEYKKYSGKYEIIRYSSTYFRLYRIEKINGIKYKNLCHNKNNNKENMKDIFLLKLYLCKENKSELNTQEFNDFKEKLKSDNKNNELPTTNNLAQIIFDIAYDKD